jgi:hypothetical protein
MACPEFRGGDSESSHFWAYRHSNIFFFESSLKQRTRGRRDIIMKCLGELDQKGVLANYLKSIIQMRTDGLPLYLCVRALKFVCVCVRLNR